MEIVVMRPSGYCMGVRRAMELVEEAIKEGPLPVSTLGQVVHNSRVEAYLASKGVVAVGDPGDAPRGVLILRSHGTTVEELSRVPEGVRVVDTTCAYVRRSEELAARYAGDGYTVVIVGNPDHPEVKAVLSRAGEDAVCVKDEDEAQTLAPSLVGRPVVVLAQTTAREALVEKTLACLTKAGISASRENTICTVTRERQESVARLAQECDLVLVVGGRTSANTAELLKIAKERGAVAFLVESGDEVSPQWFRGRRKVGIAAGASTPDWVIKEVVGKVEEIEKNIVDEEENRKEDPGGASAEDPTKIPQGEEVQEDPVIPPEEAPKAVETEAPEAEEAQAPKIDETEAPKVEETEAPKVEEAKASEVEETEAPEPVQEEEPTVEDEAQVPPEGMPMDSEEAAAMYDESFRSLEVGQIIKGRVVSVDDNGALVDVGAKSEGIIPASELRGRGAFAPQPLEPGDEIMVYVVKSDSGDGGLRLSRRRAEEDANWKRLYEAYEQGDVVEAPVSQEVKGGLVVDLGLRGFVPASQVERGYVNDLSKYVGKTLRLKVLEIDKSKNRVVVSQRAVLEEEHDRLCKETWESIAEGQERDGIVKGLTDFGVFVDLGGVDGLLHISELAWGRVKHPSEVVREGEEIKVKVLRVDREKGKISLGRKQILPDPWLLVDTKYPVDSIVTGEVTRTAPFGAFVQLEPGVEGLVHISEVATHHVVKPDDAVRSGDIVRVKVLRVRPEERRISLSIGQADQTFDEPEMLLPDIPEEEEEEENIPE